MIIPGRLSPVGSRNAPFVYGIAMPGIDLRGAEILAQLRLDEDAPGDPLSTFFIQNDYAVIDGDHYTALTLSLSEAVMYALPRMRIRSDPAVFAWDLVATPQGGYKSVYFVGTLTVMPGVSRDG